MKSSECFDVERGVECGTRWDLMEVDGMGRDGIGASQSQLIVAAGALGGPR